MKKLLYICIFVLAAATISAGCSAKTFFAVSISGKADGGLYRIKADNCRQIYSVPTLNYLISSPDRKLLYGTVNRTNSINKNGGLVFFQMGKNDMPQFKGIFTLDAVTPCHLTISPDGKFIYTANYSSGDLTEIPLKDGVPCPPFRTIKHFGRSIDRRRQKSPHPHFVGFAPDRRQLFVCDLGTDEIWLYDYTSKGISLPCAEKLKLPPGSGPRHLLFSPCGKIIFSANELNSTATSFYRSNGKWQQVKTVSTRSRKIAKKNFPGAIKAIRSGSIFFITNRGDDTIAIFESSEKGNFRLTGTVDAAGQYPSDIILNKSETALNVINLKSGSTALFELDKNAKKLHFTGKTFSIPRGIGLCR